MNPKEKAHSKLIEYGTGLDKNKRQELIDELLILFDVSKDKLTISCNTCKHVDGWRCNHKQGCEGNYELWEQ